MTISRRGVPPDSKISVFAVAVHVEWFKTVSLKTVENPPNNCRYGPSEDDVISGGLHPVRRPRRHRRGPVRDGAAAPGHDDVRQAHATVVGLAEERHRMAGGV